MSSHDRFESLAARWAERGNDASLLLDGYALVALRCWIGSHGAAADGPSAALRTYAAACEAAQPADWIDAYWDERGRCGRCGEGYRFENIMLCTDCSRTVCHRCASQGAHAANGNPACHCGGELVG